MLTVFWKDLFISQLQKEEVQRKGVDFRNSENNSNVLFYFILKIIL